MMMMMREIGREWSTIKNILKNQNSYKFPVIPAIISYKFSVYTTTYGLGVGIHLSVWYVHEKMSLIQERCFSNDAFLGHV